MITSSSESRRPRQSCHCHCRRNQSFRSLRCCSSGCNRCHHRQWSATGTTVATAPAAAGTKGGCNCCHHSCRNQRCCCLRSCRNQRCCSPRHHRCCFNHRRHHSQCQAQEWESAVWRGWAAWRSGWPSWWAGGLSQSKTRTTSGDKGNSGSPGGFVDDSSV